MTLVELCAGSAAVSLRWLDSGARPPLAWQGGKRGYADQILRAMGQEPGAGRGHDVVLVEPGPWGDAWALWRTAEGRAATCERLRDWQDEDPRTLWERLRKAPVPSEAEERVAVWAVLMFWSFGRKPVRAEGIQWDEHGFNSIEAYRETYSADRRAHDLEDWGSHKNRRLPDVIAALLALPDLSRVTVLRCRADEVEPIPGALCYIDPPYEGTTCAYGHRLSREAVLQVAQRWHAAGCTAAVSEAVPLDLPGWHHHRLGGPSGFGRTWSKQRDEWLTMSAPPKGQRILF